MEPTANRGRQRFDRSARDAMKRSVALAVALALACTPDKKPADPVDPKHADLEAGPWKFGQPQPGVDGYTNELVTALDAKWAKRSADYEPRTRHLRSDGSPKYTNRLYLESSPYLLQHAHNPVNWYPWGTEAFETARRLGRPVLLSVGYSTCHWCHVMEEQSFEDAGVARYLNEHYIAIKVDREERPDVDEIYMTAVRNLSGRGGWPMTVWLTPDRTPFHGGTYFPKARFMSSLKQMSDLYADNPARVAATSADTVAAIRRTLEPYADPAAVGLPDAAVLEKAARLFRGRFDPKWGGVVGKRKFPSGLPVRFLLRYHRRTGDKAALHAALFSLEKMAAGGMYDHVGGGFHRYSTDPKWLVPHFEKMLYDNALLVSAYLEAHEITGREDFARVVRETLRWVERDMTSPDGAFYSATDADSMTPAGHSEEGYFFTWTPDELSAILTDEAAADVTAYWGVTSAGNFEGRNILNTPEPLASVAKRLGKQPEALRATVDVTREALYIERARRPPPLRDEKILTAWNGLMISAHANAAVALREPAYAERGAIAMRFILSKLRDSNGRLLRSYKDGSARHNGYLDDYAFCIAALLDLFEATSEQVWLREAIALDAILEKHYEDKLNGGFFFTSDDHEKLLAREKPRYDGAVPTGNSVHVLNLLRLEELTSQERYRQRAELAMGAFDALLRRAPSAMSEMLNAIDFYLDLPKQIVIVTSTSAREAEPLLATLADSFVPNRIIVVATEGEVAARSKLTPLVENKIARDGKATAYVCERRVCQLPTSDPAVFAKQIRKTRPLRAAN